MKLAIVGTGYVGLVTGACLAHLGHHVVCIDSNAGRIAGLRDGVVPFFEPGLAEVVKAGSAAQRLHFSVDLAACAAAAAVFIAVGTPPRDSDGQADLSAVFAVAGTLAPVMQPGALLVTKSTVPVGTGDAIERLVTQAGGRSLAVVANPEFLREGSAVADFLAPERLVIGTASAAALAVMREIYQPLIDRGVPLIAAGRRTAELAKYAANGFLAMKVAFINEMADLCEQTGAEVAGIARIIGSDSRIGARFLKAGPGFGGSCFPKDSMALAETARGLGTPLRLIEASISANTARSSTMLRKIAAACDGSLAGAQIAVWGLTFKAGTDDMRASPALPIVADLVAAGAKVTAYDPQGMPAARAMGVPATFAAGPYDAAAGADALVLLTEWNEFRQPDYGELASLMRRRVIVDLRNALTAADARQHGFAYTGIGLGAGCTPSAVLL